MKHAINRGWTENRLAETTYRGSRWMEILGVALIILGIIALGPVAITSLASVYLLGALMVVAGVAQVAISFAYWRRRWAGFFLGLAVGCLYVIAGIISFVSPQAALVGLTYALGVIFITMGVLRMTYGLLSHFPGWGWGVLTGVVDLLLGILILAWWPADSLVVLGTLVAVELIVAGVHALVIGMAVRKLVAPLREPERPRPITRFQH